VYVLAVGLRLGFGVGFCAGLPACSAFRTAMSANMIGLSLRHENQHLRRSVGGQMLLVIVACEGAFRLEAELEDWNEANRSFG
jgi:hypothetical protein